MVDNSRGTQRRRFVKSIGVGIAGVTLAGCTDDAGSPSSGEGGNESENNSGGTTIGSSEEGGSNGTVKIGSLAPNSGTFSSSGEYVTAGNRLAAKKINEEGGIAGKDVEAVVGDTETDPQAASSVAERLIQQEDIDMFSGAVSSSVGLAVRPIAEENEIPYNAGIASLKYGSEVCSPYVYANNPSTKMTANAYLPYFREEREMENVFFITADYEWGQNAWEYYQSFVPELGAEIAGNSFAAFGAKDFSSQISKAMNSGADTLVLTLYGQDIVKCVNQLLQFNAREQFNTVSTVVNSIQLNRAMNELEGFFFGGKYYWGVDSERNREFVDAFRNEYNEVPPMPAALQYGSTYEMLRAAQEADSTVGEDISRELEGWSVDPYYKGGKATFRDCDHRLISDVFLMRGKAESERESEDDLLAVVERFNGEDIAAECSGCDLPAW